MTAVCLLAVLGGILIGIGIAAAYVLHAINGWEDQ